MLAKCIAEHFQEKDLVLIDCAPTESVFTTAAYHASRFVLVPVRPEYFATIGFPLLQQSLDAFRNKNKGHQIDVIGIVVNNSFYHGGNEEPRSKTRLGGMPRIFKFLITMNAAEVKTMLDDRMFSGPAELGPIADAIRSKAKEMRMGTQEPRTRTAALLQGGEQAQNARGASAERGPANRVIAHGSTSGTKPD